MLRLIIPKPLLDFIDSNRGAMSRALFIIKCIDEIKRLNITIDKYNERSNNDVLLHKGNESVRHNRSKP